MKIKDLLNEMMTADDIEDFWQGTKKIVKDKAKQQKILKIIKDIDADEWFTEDDIEDMYLEIKKVVDANELKKILKLLNTLS